MPLLVRVESKRPGTTKCLLLDRFKLPYSSPCEREQPIKLRGVESCFLACPLDLHVLPSARHDHVHIDVGGTITGEHGVGVEKMHLMARMFNPQTIQTFKAIKDTFDPDHRINDAKKIPSDTTYVELVKNVAPNVPGGAMA